MSETLAPVAPRSVSLAAKLRQYYALTKPRVVQLIVFCALIGMLLATPGLPDWRLALAAVAGIWLVAAAAATSQMPATAARARRQSGSPGVASSMPIRAQKTISWTTRGFVSA